MEHEHAKQYRVLVADDEEKIRFGISLSLKMKGYAVECVSDGQTALRRILETQGTGDAFDLIICDIQMPGMNGEEVLSRIKQIGLEIPVLAITGYGEKDLVVRLMRQGCRDFLDKPFAPEQLQTAVEKALRENTLCLQEKCRTERLARIGQNVRETMHDLNNLLGSALGHAELALDNYRGDDRGSNYIRKVMTSTTLAARVCRSLLLHEDPAHDQEPDKVLTDMRTTVEHAGAALHGIAPEGIDVSIDAGGSPLWVKMDSFLIQRAIINLGINALDAMPGGGMLHISLSKRRATRQGASEAAQCATVCISDTGQGIAEDTLEKIFIDGYTTKKYGSGMGLPIVTSIVEQHGGWVSVESTPGRGTRFTLDIPFVQSPAKRTGALCTSAEHANP